MQVAPAYQEDLLDGIERYCPDPTMLTIDGLSPPSCKTFSVAERFPQRVGLNTADTLHVLSGLVIPTQVLLTM